MHVLQHTVSATRASSGKSLACLVGLEYLNPCDNSKWCAAHKKIWREQWIHNLNVQRCPVFNILQTHRGVQLSVVHWSWLQNKKLCSSHQNPYFYTFHFAETKGDWNLSNPTGQHSIDGIWVHISSKVLIHFKLSGPLQDVSLLYVGRNRSEACHDCSPPVTHHSPTTS